MTDYDDTWYHGAEPPEAPTEAELTESLQNLIKEFRALRVEIQQLRAEMPKPRPPATVWRVKKGVPQ